MSRMGTNCSVRYGSTAGWALRSPRTGEVMPGYRGHLIGGACAFALVLLCVTKPYTLLNAGEWLCFALLGSLFPDVDVKSKGQMLFYRAVVVCALFFAIQKWWQALGILGALALFPQLCNHRGVFHEPWFLLAVPSAAVISIHCCAPQYVSVAVWDAVFFAAGAFSHIFLDRGIKGVLRF